MPNPWEHPEYAARFRDGPTPQHPLRRELVADGNRAIVGGLRPA